VKSLCLTYVNRLSIIIWVNIHLIIVNRFNTAHFKDAHGTPVENHWYSRPFVKRGGSENISNDNKPATVTVILFYFLKMTSADERSRTLRKREVAPDPPHTTDIIFRRLNVLIPKTIKSIKFERVKITFFSTRNRYENHNKTSEPVFDA